MVFKLCINGIFKIMNLDVKLVGLSEDNNTRPIFKNSLGKEFDITGLSSGEKQLFLRALSLKFLDVNNSVILITMTQEFFLNYIRQIMNSDNSSMLAILDTITREYDYSKKYGDIYFIECKNNKYKIGCTTDFVRRWNSLKNEEQNQAIYMIDIFKSNDIHLDEARLQCACYDYKDNSNKVMKYIQEVGNSELYKKCIEVERIWKDYEKRLR